MRASCTAQLHTPGRRLRGERLPSLDRRSHTLARREAGLPLTTRCGDVACPRCFLVRGLADKKLLAQGHAGDRVFYTDGTMHCKQPPRSQDGTRDLGSAEGRTSRLTAPTRCKARTVANALPPLTRRAVHRRAAAMPYVNGSKDGVLKGGGLAKELVESLGFLEKVRAPACMPHKRVRGSVLGRIGSGGETRGSEARAEPRLSPRLARRL